MTPHKIEATSTSRGHCPDEADGLGLFFGGSDAARITRNGAWVTRVDRAELVGRVEAELRRCRRRRGNLPPRVVPFQLARRTVRRAAGEPRSSPPGRP